jgi:hypothetical protein
MTPPAMAPTGGPESCDDCCEGVAVSDVDVAVAGVLEVAEKVLDAVDEDDAAAGNFCQYIATTTYLGISYFRPP